MLVWCLAGSTPKPYFQEAGRCFFTFFEKKLKKVKINLKTRKTRKKEVVKKWPIFDAIY